MSEAALFASSALALAAFSASFAFAALAAFSAFSASSASLAAFFAASSAFLAASSAAFLSSSAFFSRAFSSSIDSACLNSVRTVIYSFETYPTTSVSTEILVQPSSVAPRTFNSSSS